MAESKHRKCRHCKIHKSKLEFQSSSHCIDCKASTTKKCSICLVTKPKKDFYERGLKCRKCQEERNNKERRRYPVLETNHFCPMCSTSLPYSDFYISDIRKNGLSKICKQCTKIKYPHKYKSRTKYPPSNILSKYCSSCKCICNISEFTIDSSYKDGYNYACKNCLYRRMKSANEKCRTTSVIAFIHAMLKQKKQRQKHGRHHLLGEGVDEAFLLNLYNSQSGKCALSGIKMTLFPKRGLSLMSLDRIDSSIAYTKTNVQFVCLGLNIAKSNHPIADFKQWINEVSNSITEQQRRLEFQELPPSDPGD